MPSLAKVPTRTVTRDESYLNVRDLLDRLGGIPAERVRMWPPPGTATLADLIECNDTRSGEICELVERTLVEKTVGMSESKAAVVLGMYFENWNEDLNLGFSGGADGNVQLVPDLSFAPDTAFYRWDQFPDRRSPTDSVPLMYPNLAVEILSKSNTKKEMARKRREYFSAGTRIVWEVDLKKETVVVFHEADRGETLGPDGVLSGEEIMPGFTLLIRKWFDRVRREG